jgi:hypothetical protein
MNLTKENNMTVYVVMGGVNYEGESIESVKIFTNEDDAVTYGEGLVSAGHYDYFEVVIKGIN